MPIHLEGIMAVSTIQWVEVIRPSAGENRKPMAIAFALLLLLPWMFIFARAGIEICAAGIGLLFLWRSAVMRDWQWLRDPFVRVAFVAWLWLMLVVSPFALKPEHAFFLALPWIRYILLVAALRYWLLTSREAFVLLGKVLAVMLAFCVIDSLWQYMTGLSLTHHVIWESGRLTGPFVSPKIGMFVARFTLPLAAICVVVAPSVSRRMSVLFFVGVLFCVAVVLLSGERTATAMTLGSLGLAALVIAWRVKSQRVVALGLISVLVIATLALFYTQATVRNTLDRAVGHVEEFSHSPYGQVYAVAVQTGREHWLTGVGMGGLREVMPEPYAILGKDIVVDAHYLHAHNPYLEWFAEAGVPGLLLFLAVVVCLLCEVVQLMRRTHGVAVVIPAFMLGAVLFHFFPVMSTQSYFSNWTGIMVWYSLAVVLSLRNLLPVNGAVHV